MKRGSQRTRAIFYVLRGRDSEGWHDLDSTAGADALDFLREQLRLNGWRIWARYREFKIVERFA